MSKLNQKIKELRLEKSLSVKYLADIFEVSARTVQRWETGENVPPINTIIEIAKYFGVTTDYLLGVDE